MSTPPSDLGPTSPDPVALDAERTAWLTRLYEANVRTVFATCRRLLNSREDAADATQEVFLRAAASLHVAPDGKDARAWLTTVARNYCLDILRRRHRLRSALTTLGAGLAQPESETIVVDRQLAQAVLDQLAVRERQALWESHVEQRSVGEIAERLGLTYLAAAQLLSRARRRAALVAAELAAIFALLRSGLARRRMALQNLAHPVAAVLVVPLVAIVVISAGSGTPYGYTAHAFVAQSVPHTVPRRRADVGEVAPKVTPAAPAVPTTTVARVAQTAAPVRIAAVSLPPAHPVLPLPNPAPVPDESRHKKPHHKGHGHGKGDGDDPGDQ